jgi:hypothetical protein
MESATLVAGHAVDHQVARAELRSAPAVGAARGKPLAWSNLSNLFLIAPLVGILSLPVWLAPAHIVFKDFGLTDVVNLLAVLFLVALLAERALEIFVATWRSPEASQLDLAVRTCEQDADRLQARPEPDPSALRDARVALEEAKSQELRYKCGTRQAALWAGLALGFLVSGVGVRALETLVDPALSGWSASQSAAFRLVDVLLTGGVIAGGSEGIHRIATVFDSFMSATAKRAKHSA